MKILLLMFFMVNVANANIIRTRDEKIDVALYTFRGKPIWTEAEKQMIIEHSAATAPITNEDFIAVDMPIEKEFLDGLRTSGKSFTRSGVLRKINEEKARR